METASASYSGVGVKPIVDYLDWKRKNDTEAEMKYLYTFGNKREYEFEFTSVPGNYTHWIGEFKKGFDEVSDEKETNKVLKTIEKKVVTDFSSGVGSLDDTNVDVIEFEFNHKNKEKIDVLKKFYKNISVPEEFRKGNEDTGRKKFSFFVKRN